MPTTAGVGASSSTNQVAQHAQQNVFSSLDPQAFLKLLVAQIQYQNPMDPSDPTAMMGQLAQYAQVEALNSLKAMQASTNSLNEATIASSLIGKQVTTTDADDRIVSGTVSAVRFTDAGPVLVCDTGAELSLSAVQRVDAPRPATATAAADAPAASTPPTSTPPTSTPEP